MVLIRHTFILSVPSDVCCGFPSVSGSGRKAMWGVCGVDLASDQALHASTEVPSRRSLADDHNKHHDLDSPVRPWIRILSALRRIKILTICRVLRHAAALLLKGNSRAEPNRPQSSSLGA